MTPEDYSLSLLSLLFSRLTFVCITRFGAPFELWSFLKGEEGEESFPIGATTSVWKAPSIIIERRPKHRSKKEKGLFPDPSLFSVRPGLSSGAKWLQPGGRRERGTTTTTTTAAGRERRGFGQRDDGRLQEGGLVDAEVGGLLVLAVAVDCLLSPLFCGARN